MVGIATEPARTEAKASRLETASDVPNPATPPTLAENAASANNKVGAEYIIVKGASSGDYQCNLIVVYFLQVVYVHVTAAGSQFDE